ncbi:MAG: TlpA disulfide reductase family protein [Siphonobacter sp.]
MMNFKSHKYDIYIFVLSWVPFFLIGHLKAYIGWLISLILYLFYYYWIGTLRVKYLKNKYINDIVIFLSVVGICLFLYIDAGHYYYPGIGPVILASGFLGYFLGRNKKPLAGLNAILMALLIVVLCAWYYLYLPQYNYKKLTTHIEYDGLKGQKPVLEFQTLNGTVVPADTFKNKVVLLDFWYTGCATCLVKLKYFEKLKQHFSNRDDVYITSVNAGHIDSKSKLLKYISDKNITFSMLYDVNGLFENKYKIGIDGYPVEIRIDKQGYIRQVLSGTSSEDIYLTESIEFVNSLLNRK